MIWVIPSGSVGEGWWAAELACATESSMDSPGQPSQAMQGVDTTVESGIESLRALLCSEWVC